MNFRKSHNRCKRPRFCLSKSAYLLRCFVNLLVYTIKPNCLDFGDLNKVYQGYIKIISHRIADNQCFYN